MERAPTTVDLAAWPGATELFVPFAGGVVATTRVGEELRRLVRTGVRAMLGGVVDLSLELPAVVPARVAERADYLAAFPHLLGVVRSFTGTRQDQLPLLRAARRGDDWGGLLDGTGLVLPAAACHGVYELLAGTSVDGLQVEVAARCFRHEATCEATRFQSFEMVEIVCVGDDDEVRVFATEGLKTTRYLLDGFGLPATAEPANDPFFGAAAALLVAEQQATDAKTELVAGGPGGPFAVASVNRHGDHFGRAFAIDAGGAPASSACIAFGIERLMLALLVSDTPASHALLDRARARAQVG
jgi:hypothetical protein